MVTLILLTALGFAAVILGAHFLVNGTCSLAKRLAVSELVIGLTVVAFGTSLPELSVNITASIKGDAGIALGNILGSNIANIFLILGISSIIFPLAVTKGTVWKEIPLSLLAAILVGILANDYLIDGNKFSALTRIDGLVLISFFIIFLYYSVGIAGDVPGAREQIPAKKYGLTRIFILMIAGFFGLIVGSRWVVTGAVGLAEKLGVSQSLIGLTIVAVGTSLPELATSAMAAYKKNPDIAIGNVVGSNIFNIFFILGVSSIIRPIPFEAKSNIDVGVAIAASLLLFICMFTGKRRVLDRWEGGVFLVLYAGYIFFLIMQK
jgi:cation:H+ antiporter